MGLSAEEQNTLLLSGLLHDCGAFSLKEIHSILQTDVKNLYKHSELGYLLLRNFEFFSKIAILIRYHHVCWNKGQGSEFRGNKVPIGSHILHLADRVDILIRREKEILGQVKGICAQIRENSGTMFLPELVDVFMSLSTKEYFWFDIVSPSISSILKFRSKTVPIDLDIMDLLNYAKLFRKIIDFRSRLTATHSSEVAATAEALAKYIGFSERECHMMKIAGCIHDLGKLAVPNEILEKPNKLSEDEFYIIKSHPYYTYRILETISDLNVINVWASLHHERLDGTGYPFHYKGENLPLGSRIMAVADVFTAITEDRPYRKGMSKDKASQVLQQMAQNSALDSNIVSTLIIHYDEVDSIRFAAQAAAFKEYQEFKRQSGHINWLQ